MIDDYPMAGPPDISRDDFTRILAENASPAAVESDGMYDACLAEGVSPVTFLAFFNHESGYGKLGICFDYDTKNPGNVRSPEDPTLGVVIDTRGGNFAKYPTWENGALDWGKRIVGPKYAGEGLLTVCDVLPKYAPTGDNNDPEAYIDSVLGYIDTHGIPEVVAQQAATLTYDVSYPIVEASVTSGGNYGPTRQGHQALVVVVHITDGPTASSAIGWFRNPESDVSAHYVVDRDADATIYRCLDEACCAWAQGVVESPDLSVPIVAGWVRDGVNPNLEAVSIETAGLWQDGFTAAQIDAVGWLVGDICRRQNIPIDRDHVLGHYQISGTQRANCPSLSDAQWDTILTIARAGTPAEPSGPYDTADEAYDAYCQEQQDVVIWAGEIRDKGHWYSRNPQEVSRTVNNRLLAYDGGYAQDAGGWQLDEWQEAAKASGQLAIYGEPPPAPPDPGTPGTPDPPGPPSLVGAAWPINPGDGATDVATDVTLQWGSDAPTSDVEFEQSDGVRIFALQAHPSTAYGPLELAEATTYVWRVRGRDSGNVSDWTAASFGTAHPVPETPDKPDTPDKPASGEPYPPVVSPTHAEQPAATTWVNVKSGRTDYAVSERWRPDGAAGGGDWPDSAQHCDPSYPGREDPDPTWLDIRKLTRRLSMMPAISEALLRAGMFERVPATEDPCSRDWWAEGASEDWGDECSNLPQHVHVWASRLCTLGLALGAAPTVWQAFVALGFSEAEGHILSSIYHCLRRRCRDMSEIAHC